jgi:hypothetical protein
MRSFKRIWMLTGLLLVVVCLWPAKSWLVPRVVSLGRTLTGNKAKTVENRLAEFGNSARERLRPYFAQSGLEYPPQAVTMLTLKLEGRLELYAPTPSGAQKFVWATQILAASGELGPKLREGDYQVPEGVYPVESLNPNSLFHVSLRVGYPNRFDREKARLDQRSNLGGDIMIHGGAASVGCIAVGDEAAEKLFVLANDVGLTNITVVISPVDFRARALPESPETSPVWTAELYELLKSRLSELPKP